LSSARPTGTARSTRASRASTWTRGKRAPSLTGLRAHGLSGPRTGGTITASRGARNRAAIAPCWHWRTYGCCGARGWCGGSGSGPRGGGLSAGLWRTSSYGCSLRRTRCNGLSRNWRRTRSCCRNVSWGCGRSRRWGCGWCRWFCGHRDNRRRLCDRRRGSGRNTWSSGFWRRWRDPCRGMRSRSLRRNGSGWLHGNGRGRSDCWSRGRSRNGLGRLLRGGFRVGSTLQCFANFFGDIDGNRTGVRLLFGYTKPRKKVDDCLGLDLQLAGQFINSYLG
jgi:hypothetical protein